MDTQGWLSAVSAAAGASVVVGTVARRYWAGREVRQQAAFRAAVAQIIREQTGELLEQQARLLAKQREQLDRQDRQLAAMRRTVEQIRNGGTRGG